MILGRARSLRSYRRPRSEGTSRVKEDEGMRYLRIIAAVLLFIGGVGGWYFLVNREQLTFGCNETPTQPGLGVIAYGYVITLAGVVLGAIYRELQARRARGQ